MRAVILTTTATSEDGKHRVRAVPESILRLSLERNIEWELHMPRMLTGANQINGIATNQ